MQPDAPRHSESSLPAAASGSSLLVVGIGIQWGGQTTLAAERAIRGSDQVLFAVADPWAAQWIRSLNESAEALPYPRDGRSRAEIYRAMTERILARLGEGKRVCAVFYGSPTFLARSAHDAVKAAEQAGFRAKLLPGVSSIECLAADLGVDFGESGYQLFEAGDFLLRPRRVDPHAYLVLCQIAMIGQAAAYDADGARVRHTLGLLQERLLADFPAAHRVFVYEAARHPLARARIAEIALGELYTIEVSEVSTLCVPPVAAPAVDEEMARRITLPTGKTSSAVAK